MSATPARYSGFIGRTDDGDRVFVTIELRHHDRPAQTTTHDEIDSWVELSITAEAYAAGRALTGDTVRGGQYREAGTDVMAGEIAAGLDVFDLAELTELWNRWHVNGMRAGCAHQPRRAPMTPGGYGYRTPDLDAVPECPAVVLSEMPVTAEDYRPAYRYGSAWLVEVMPAEVIARVHALGERIEAVDEDQAEEEVETISFDDAADRYAEMLNDCHDEIKIGYASFGAGDVLRRMDPIMFSEGVNEWADTEGIEIA